MSKSKTSISTDPETPIKPKRREFSAEDKKRILQELAHVKERGGVSAVTAREGIDVSRLCSWLTSDNERLRLHNQQLQDELEKAQAIIKLLELLARPFQFVIPADAK